MHDLIRAYPSTQLASSYGAPLSATRAAAVDLAHCLLQQTTQLFKRTDELETLIIEALLIAVHYDATLIQNKMLRALQTILVTKTSQSGRPDMLQRRVSSTTESQGPHKLGESLGRSEVDVSSGSPFLVSHKAPTPSTTMPPPKQPHRLLLPLLQRGLVSVSNRSIFLSGPTLSSLRHNSIAAAPSLFCCRSNQTICEMIARATLQVGGSYVPAPADQRSAPSWWSSRRMCPVPSTNRICFC